MMHCVSNLIIVLFFGSILCSLIIPTPVVAFSAPSSVSTTTTTTISSPSAAVTELINGDIAWNSLVGEADRVFRLGIQLDKNGQSRKASVAFHEAATLYQCFLDSKSEFGHVTSLPDGTDCRAVLAHACRALGDLNLDALKNPMAANRLYRLSNSHNDPSWSIRPSSYCYDGMGVSWEAANAGQDLDQAIQNYRQALELDPENRSAKFHLAVALDRQASIDNKDGTYQFDKNEEANALFEELRRDEAIYACWVDSWGYVRWHTRKVPPTDLNLYRGTRDMLEIALHAAGMDGTNNNNNNKKKSNNNNSNNGLVCEFGVGSGRSLRMAQEIVPLDQPIHGFDTFTGLPQAWGSEPAGSYSTGGRVPNMEGKVYFYKGLFRDTVGPFLQEAGDDAYLAYANIDCRLYSSTLDVLEAMHGRILPGTILIFDEYICHPTWRQDEFRAWRECCKRFGWKYEYIAFSLGTKQAIIRVIDA